LVTTAIWPQPLDPLNSTVLSALVAALPLILILVLMGGLRKSGLFASACGLAAAGLLAMLIWHMPLVLLLWSTAYGFIYALWPVLWIVFGGLWLYNLTQDTGKFELLRRWMEENASGDACVQAILVAFLPRSAPRRQCGLRSSGRSNRLSASRSRLCTTPSCHCRMMGDREASDVLGDIQAEADPTHQRAGFLDQALVPGHIIFGVAEPDCVSLQEHTVSRLGQILGHDPPIHAPLRHPVA
jgi:L-lactate permease